MAVNSRYRNNLMSIVGIEERFSEEKYNCFSCPKIIDVGTGKSANEAVLLVSCGGVTNGGVLVFCESCVKKIYNK